MQDLEPPEVPLELMSQMSVDQMSIDKASVIESKKDDSKESFFKRMFTKKTQSSPTLDNSSINLPELTLPTNDFTFPDINLPAMEMPSSNANNNLNFNLDMDKSFQNHQDNLPVLPSLANQLEDVTSNKFNESDTSKSKISKLNNKAKGKAKKGQKKDINKLDESSQFDWNREISDQEILIHDSNRFNQDINLLITQADNHVEDKMSATTNDVFLSPHQEITPNLEVLPIQDINTTLMSPLPVVSQEMPKVDLEQQKIFAKLSTNHQKVRSVLQRYLKQPKLFNNKAKVIELFKQYDENIEKNIEDKEMELTKKKRHLERYEKHLTEQETDIKNMYNYMKGLNDKLKDREEKINSIIEKAVIKDLSRRLKTDKALLKEGLVETTKLNTDLKKKVKIIEEDRVRFEREHKNMSEMERKKLNELQSIYEKKLNELELEKKTFNEDKKLFEEKRKHVFELIKQGDAVAKELDYVKKIKSSIDENKKAVEKELNEDKELKQAITAAEQKLIEEKENLDKAIFNKYLENKLKSIKPEYLEKRSDWKAELQSHPLYAQISQCKQLLSQRNINEAKSLYNVVRKSYEQVQTSPKEKEALYYVIRELYNEIQLKIVEAQLNLK